MAVKVQTIWIPRSDRTLAGANAALRFLNLSPDQIESFQVTHAGPEYRKMLLSYEESMPPVLVASDIRQGAWFHTDYAPEEVRLLFNVPIQEGSVEDGDFLVVTNSGVEEVAAAGVEFDGEELTIPLDLTGGYIGPVTVVGSGFSSQDGVAARRSIALGFVVGSGLPLPQAPSNEAKKTPRRGRLRVAKLVVTAGQEANMFQAFRRHWAIPDENVIETVYLGSEADGQTEVYLLWYERTGPSILAITPDQSFVAETSGLERIHLSFDQPLAGLTTDEADLSVPDGVTYGVIQVTEDRTQWALTGNFDVPGHYSLRLDGIRDHNGDSLEGVDYYSWQVMPSELNHADLAGLTGDDHTQYLLLAGRPGGQHAYGSTEPSGNLTLSSTTDSTTGNVIVTDALKIQSRTSFNNVVTATLTIDVNDWSFAGLANATIVRVDPDAARNVTGISGGEEGRILRIFNVSSGGGSIVLKNDSNLSSAENRIITEPFGRDIQLLSGHGVTLWYDSVSSRWRIGDTIAQAAEAQAGKVALSQNGGTSSLEAVVGSDSRLATDMVYLTFNVANPAALATTRLGVVAGVGPIVVGTAGVIRMVSAHFTGVLNTGAGVARANINGTTDNSLTVTMVAGNTTYFVTGTGTSVSAGDAIMADIITDALWNGTTGTLVVTIGIMVNKP